MRKVYPLASYLTINISSPNTKNLRRLQEADELDRLLAALKAEQAKLADEHGRYVPMALKIAPDLTAEQLHSIAELLLAHRIDAVVATNTTVSREGVEGLAHAEETGGLSGAPLAARSTQVVRQLAATAQGPHPDHRASAASCGPRTPRRSWRPAPAWFSSIPGWCTPGRGWCAIAFGGCRLGLQLGSRPPEPAEAREAAAGPRRRTSIQTRRLMQQPELSAGDAGRARPRAGATGQSGYGGQLASRLGRLLYFVVFAASAAMQSLLASMIPHPHLR